MHTGEVFEYLRNALDLQPSLYKAFSITAPVDSVPEIVAGLSYAKFLTKFSNGGRFGLIDLWSSEELAQKQFRMTEPVNWLSCLRSVFDILIF